MSAGPQLDAATVLLQWATGGLLFCWVTTRRRELGVGYGWLLRSSYAVIAALAALAGYGWSSQPVRDAASVGVAGAAATALLLSVVRRHSHRTPHTEQPKETTSSFDPRWDLLAPAIGITGLVAAGIGGGGNELLQTARILVGAAFLGSVTDAMLLGHWYLVQLSLIHI